MVNLGRVPTASAVRMIDDLARRDFRTTPESQSALDDLALTSEIRARVGLEERIPDDRMDIEVRDGMVTVRTTARFMADVPRVGEIARTVPGVREVRSELKE
jgi:osmotically-inducible protein OsmY